MVAIKTEKDDSSENELWKLANGTKAAAVKTAALTNTNLTASKSTEKRPRNLRRQLQNNR